jgi:N-acetylmuramoyl-L-alanine amidase
VKVSERPAQMRVKRSCRRLANGNRADVDRWRPWSGKLWDAVMARVPDTRISSSPHRASLTLTGGSRLCALAGALAAAAVLLGASPGSGSAAIAGGHALDPALFAPGSCVSFAPTSAQRHTTVFIDAGHGGPDPGAVGVTQAGRPVHEASVTLSVALATMALLRASGYQVLLSRTGAAAVARAAPGDLSGGVFTGQGVHRDLIARDLCANRAKASILLGVYFNASASASVGGSLTLYDAARPFSPANLRLAGLVQRAVLARLSADGWRVPDDGVRPDVGFGSSVTNADRAYGHLLIIGPAKAGYFSTPSEMPGALIEPLFVTNPAEASLADSVRGQQSIARGLATAVEQYFAVRHQGCLFTARSRCRRRGGRLRALRR